MASSGVKEHLGTSLPNMLESWQKLSSSLGTQSNGNTAPITGLKGLRHSQRKIEMKKALTKSVNVLTGDVSGLTGDVSELTGNVTGVYGNASGLTGNVSGLRGDVSDLYGDATGLSGNIDDCELTDEERSEGVDIKDLFE